MNKPAITAHHFVSVLYRPYPFTVFSWFIFHNSSPTTTVERVANYAPLTAALSYFRDTALFELLAASARTRIVAPDFFYPTNERMPLFLQCSQSVFHCLFDCVLCALEKFSQQTLVWCLCLLHCILLLRPHLSSPSGETTPHELTLKVSRFRSYLICTPYQTRAALISLVLVDRETSSSLCNS
jgi:hypothetical protein